jgi:hypothetical protein
MTNMAWAKTWHRFKAKTMYHREFNPMDERLSDQELEDQYKSMPWMVMFLDSHPTHINDVEVLESMKKHKVGRSMITMQCMCMMMMIMMTMMR